MFLNVCPGDPRLHQLHGFMSETGHELERFPDRIIFAVTCCDISKWQNKKVQRKVQLKRKKWLLTQQDSDLGIG